MSDNDSIDILSCCILVFHSFIYLVINFASLSLSLSASTVL